MGTNKGPSNENKLNECKLRNKRRRHLVSNVFYEYTQRTSLQGIPYTTKKGLNVTERSPKPTRCSW